MTPPAVLFWDVDGTLLTTARAGISAWEGALAELTGRPADLSDLHTAGLTDAGIAALLLEREGLPTADGAVHELLRAYDRRLPEALHRRQGAVLPGVHEVLDDLRSRDALSLLLTGNTPAGAAAKLAHYGLAEYFERGGAFCEGPGARETIAARAFGLAAEALGDDPDLDRLYVIGDTPHDVRCGRSIGARTIAVASGVHSAEELAAHDPWTVLERLPEPASFRRLVGLEEG